MNRYSNRAWPITFSGTVDRFSWNPKNKYLIKLQSTVTNFVEIDYCASPISGKNHISKQKTTKKLNFLTQNTLWNNNTVNCTFLRYFQITRGAVILHFLQWCLNLISGISSDRTLVVGFRNSDSLPLIKLTVEILHDFISFVY